MKWITCLQSGQFQSLWTRAVEQTLSGFRLWLWGWHFLERICNAVLISNRETRCFNLSSAMLNIQHVNFTGQIAFDKQMNAFTPALWPACLTYCFPITQASLKNRSQVVVTPRLWCTERSETLWPCVSISRYQSVFITCLHHSLGRYLSEALAITQGGYSS